MQSMKRAFLAIRIWHLMVVIATIAGMLAIARQYSWGFVLLLSLGLLPGVVAWKAFRGRRNAAALGFAISVVLATIPIFLLCVYSVNIGGLAIASIWAFLTVPAMIGVGVAWATAVQRTGNVNWRVSIASWLLVVASATLVVSMIPTLWPLRLAFLVSRSSLDRLADRVAAGETLARSEGAGLYEIVATRVDAQSGSIALLINDSPGGGSAFVRIGTRPPFESPMSNLNFDENLGGAWRYQDED